MAYNVSMTLTTKIVVPQSTVPPEIVWRACQDVLGDGEGQVWEKTMGVEYGEDGDDTTVGCVEYRNKIAQGLAAWLEMQAVELDEHQWRLRIAFDTSYGYAHNGGGCGDLHAWILTELAPLLAAVRGAEDWYWLNDGDMEKHYGLGELECLGDATKGNPHISTSMSIV